MKNKSILVRVAFLAIAFSATSATAQVKTTTRSSTRTESNKYGNSYVNLESDSANGTDRITMYKNGEVYKIKVVNDKVTEIVIDGKQVPEADFPKYESMITQLREQIKKDHEQAERDRAQAVLDRQQAEKDRQQAEKDREQAIQDRKQAEKDRAQAILDRQQAERDRAQSVKDKRQSEEDRKQADKDRAQAILDRAQAEKDREQAVKDRAQAERDRAQAEVDRKQAEVDRKQAEEDRKKLAALVEDLVKANVIKSKDELFVVQLSDESLIVNDKKQSAELHQQLKAKYLKTPKSKITYTIRNNGSQFSVEHY